MKRFFFALFLLAIPSSGVALEHHHWPKILNVEISEDRDTYYITIDKPAKKMALLIDHENGGGMSRITDGETNIIRTNIRADLDNTYDGITQTFNRLFSICPDTYLRTARGWDINECSRRVELRFTYIPDQTNRALPAGAERVFALFDSEGPHTHLMKVSNVVAITPTVDLAVDAVKPHVQSCGGACKFRTTISTRKEGRSIGAGNDQLASVRDEFMGILDERVYLRKGIEYSLFLEVIGTNSLSFWSAGTSAKSSANGFATADFSLWPTQIEPGTIGPISFELIGEELDAPPKYIEPSVPSVVTPPAKKVPPTCGNNVIDGGEECDSGHSLNEAGGFCNRYCELDREYDTKKVPIQCQTYRGNNIEEDPEECIVYFGNIRGGCTMKKSKKMCITDLILPPNNDEMHYKGKISGTLGGLVQENVSYNGIYYFVNFDYYAKIDSRKSSTIPVRTVLPPASSGEEVLTDFVAFENPFPDTDTDDLEGKAAAELYRREVVGGYPDGKFRGDRFVNRAEAAKFLLLAKYGEFSGEDSHSSFSDVGRGLWFTKYIVDASNRGIIKGYADGTFRPGNTVNTAEFLKMITLTFGIPLNLSYHYTDVPQDAWFAAYAGAASQNNLLPDRRYELLPGQDLTRREMAIAIYQLLKNR